MIAALPVDCGHGRLTFVAAFGVFGPPLLVAVGIGIAWTASLLVLTIDPNGAFNYLMSTRNYDDGMFWSLPAQAQSIKIATVAGLVVTECYYTFVLHDMVLWWRDSTLLGARLERWLNLWR